MTGFPAGAILQMPGPAGLLASPAGRMQLTSAGILVCKGAAILAQGIQADKAALD